MSIRRRLEALEGRIPPPQASSGVSERMRAHLERVAALRRAGATPENNAELRAFRIALDRRLEEHKQEKRPWAT